jgi:Bifunctional DNA primase/polymerase, N-terminal
MRVKTAKGLRLYFPYSNNRPLRNNSRVTYQGKVLELDIRATGGYVVGRGTVHPSGLVYAREGSGW